MSPVFANLPALCLACLLAGCATYQPGADPTDVARMRDIEACQIQAASPDTATHAEHFMSCMDGKGYQWPPSWYQGKESI